MNTSWTDILKEVAGADIQFEIVTDIGTFIGNVVQVTDFALDEINQVLLQGESGRRYEIPTRYIRTLRSLKTWKLPPDFAEKGKRIGVLLDEQIATVTTALNVLQSALAKLPPPSRLGWARDLTKPPMTIHAQNDADYL